jgi:ABC-2 type transport system ATP-binding protein
MSSHIEVTHASKNFRRKAALDDVSFKVPAGSVFGLLGENGAGKTTLIRSMLGYYKLDRGSIDIAGLDPQRDPMSVRRKVGYLSDSPALYEWMKVLQIGWFTSGFYPEGFLARFNRLAEEFELQPTAKIRNLSKGQKGKLALALVMSGDPDIYIMDEPTSGLDPQVRRRFLESMADLASQGKTILLSSHHIPEVERVADWIAILHQGRLRICGPVDVLKERIQSLSFSIHDPSTALPKELDELTLISKKRIERSVHVIATNVTNDWLQRLRSCYDIFDLQLNRINLEELYLAITDSNSEWSGTIFADDEPSIDSPVALQEIST